MNYGGNEDFKNRLSSMANIQLEGGVNLNELQDDKRGGNLNWTKLSGGDFKVQDKPKEKNGNGERRPLKQMSIPEYRSMQGIRTFDNKNSNKPTSETTRNDRTSQSELGTEYVKIQNVNVT